MWYELKTDSAYAFNVERGKLSGGQDCAEALGGFLFNSLVDVSYAENLANEYGLERLSAYLHDRRFGSSLRGRVTDFGEVVAGELLKAHEGFRKPIEKLRYKDHHDFPLHLTDVLCLEMDQENIKAFVYCEVKAGTTPPDKSLGSKAFQSILRDWLAKMPEILYFISEKLWHEGRFEEQRFFDEAIYREEPPDRVLRLVFIFDETIWDEDVLTNLETDFLAADDRDEALVCYVLTSAAMRDLLTASYEAAAKTGGS